jgi:hypothetical protein
LSPEDLRDLEELGLVPPEVTEDAERDREVMETASTSGLGERAGDLIEQAQTADDDGMGKEGVDWFEAMVEGSRLGRTNTRRHGERRGNGWKVEWEIVEWIDGEEEGAASADSGKGSGKRKLGEVEDIGMDE